MRLTQENACCPNFEKYKFGGQLRLTDTFARRSFRAIPGNWVNGVFKAYIECDHVQTQSIIDCDN